MCIIVIVVHVVEFSIGIHILSSHFLVRLGSCLSNLVSPNTIRIPLTDGRRYILTSIETIKCSPLVGGC